MTLIDLKKVEKHRFKVKLRLKRQKISSSARFFKDLDILKAFGFRYRSIHALISQSDTLPRFRELIKLFLTAEVLYNPEWKIMLTSFLKDCSEMRNYGDKIYTKLSIVCPELIFNKKMKYPKRKKVLKRFNDLSAVFSLISKFDITPRQRFSSNLLYECITETLEILDKQIEKSTDLANFGYSDAIDYSW
jgi:hypothetical protein